MKGAPCFDTALLDYGAATVSLQETFAIWETIDWFVPPADARAEEDALQFAGRYNALARAHQPDTFAAQVRTSVVRGGWPTFSNLCRGVEQAGWDWRSALKKLSSSHTKATGWKLQDQARGGPELKRGSPLGPGALYFRYGESVIWNESAPRLDLSSLPSDDAKAASFYLGHAKRDMTLCLEWQLAEGVATSREIHSSNSPAVMARASWPSPCVPTASCCLLSLSLPPRIG